MYSVLHNYLKTFFNELRNQRYKQTDAITAFYQMLQTTQGRFSTTTSLILIQLAYLSIFIITCPLTSPSESRNSWSPNQPATLQAIFFSIVVHKIKIDPWWMCYLSPVKWKWKNQRTKTMAWQIHRERLKMVTFSDQQLNE